MTFKFIEGTNAMDKAIDKVKRSGEKFEALVHQVAVSAIKHVIEHDDGVYMTRLVHAVPRSLRRNSLINWFVEHTNFTFEGTGAEGKFIKDKRKTWSKELAEANLKLAIDKPFYLGKAKEGVEWTPEADLKAVLGFISRHIDTAKKKEGTENYVSKLERARASLAA